jgi:type IV fimbrial biogenesis protein FimT
MIISANKRHIGAQGFTLLELMITLTVAGAIVGMAVPAFNRMAANSRIVTQTNDMVGAINFARSEAITRNGTVTFCRTDSETSTTCATELAEWTNWIVLNAGGVVRRGTVNTYRGSMKLSSDLTLDAMTFGSDGLGRTGTALISNRAFTLCTTSIDTDNFRVITVGAGSRLSTTKLTGTC